MNKIHVLAKLAVKVGGWLDFTLKFTSICYLHTCSLRLHCRKSHLIQAQQSLLCYWVFMAALRWTTWVAVLLCSGQVDLQRELII